MSIIEPQDREPVEIEPRRYMTHAEKVRCWEACGRVCSMCKKPCKPFGPEVIWDHRVPLALGGSNDLENMEPHHVGICAAAKTREDIKRIRKAQRLERDSKPSTRRKSQHPLRSRGFQKSDPLKGGS